MFSAFTVLCDAITCTETLVITIQPHEFPTIIGAANIYEVKKYR